MLGTFSFPTVVIQKTARDLLPLIAIKYWVI